MPLVCGLALGAPSLSGVALAAGAFAAFFAHEPLLVVLGQRGRRARVEDGPRAMRRLALLGGVAIVLGALGLALAPQDARIAALPPIVLTLGVVWLVWRKEEKTTAGEAIAATALSGAAMPVALACGASWAQAGLAWLAWSLSFLLATLGVRGVIARNKHQGRQLSNLAIVTSIVVMAGAVGLWAGGKLPAAVPLGVAPFAVLALAGSLAPVHTKHLRRVGWGLIAASVATLGVLVATLR
ncbi:YwiC-like family protein [Polyangium aurulentum]|nr:YwiC-like family protein [Polyangium aurulentum]